MKALSRKMLLPLCFGTLLLSSCFDEETKQSSSGGGTSTSSAQPDPRSAQQGGTQQGGTQQGGTQQELSPELRDLIRILGPILEEPVKNLLKSGNQIETQEKLRWAVQKVAQEILEPRRLQRDLLWLIVDQGLLIDSVISRSVRLFESEATEEQQRKVSGQVGKVNGALVEIRETTHEKLADLPPETYADLPPETYTAEKFNKFSVEECFVAANDFTGHAEWLRFKVGALSAIRALIASSSPSTYMENLRAILGTSIFDAMENESFIIPALESLKENAEMCYHNIRKAEEACNTLQGMTNSIDANKNFDNLLKALAPAAKESGDECGLE